MRLLERGSQNRRQTYNPMWGRVCSLRLSPPRQARGEISATFAHTFVGTCVGVIFPQDRQPKIRQFGFIDGIANGFLDRRPSEYRIDPLSLFGKVTHLALHICDYPLPDPD